MSSVYEKGGKINIEKVDECSELEWEKKEQSLIQKYKELGHKLLNIDKGGKGVITKEKRSIDSITRSVEAHKKPVIAYNFDGTKYKDFDSITEAAKFLNGKINNIFSALIGNSKSSCGYMWKYKSDKKTISKYQKKSIGMKVYQFDLEGNFIRDFESKKDVLIFFKVNSYQALTKAINNKTEYKRFFWSLTPEVDISTFVSPFKYKITKGSQTIKVIEQKEIAEIVGIHKSTVNAKLKSSTSFYYNEYFVEVI